MQNVVPVSSTFTTWKKSIQFNADDRRNITHGVHIFYAHHMSSVQSRAHMTKVKRIVNLLSSQEEEDRISKRARGAGNKTHTFAH